METPIFPSSMTIYTSCSRSASWRMSTSCLQLEPENENSGHAVCQISWRIILASNGLRITKMWKGIESSLLKNICSPYFMIQFCFFFSQVRYDPVILRWIHVPDPEKTWTPHVWHSCSTKAPIILWSLTWCPLIELIELATIWSTLIPRSALHGCQFQADFLKIDCSWMTLGPRLISLELTPHFAHMRGISATLIHING